MLNESPEQPHEELISQLLSALNNLHLGISEVQSLCETNFIATIEHDFSEEQKSALAKVSGEKALDCWNMCSEVFKTVFALKDELDTKLANSDNALSDGSEAVLVSAEKDIPVLSPVAICMINRLAKQAGAFGEPA